LAQEAEGAGGRLIQNASRRNEGRREAAFLFGRRLIRYFTLHRRKKASAGPDAWIVGTVRRWSGPHRRPDSRGRRQSRWLRTADGFAV